MKTYSYTSSFTVIKILLSLFIITILFTFQNHYYTSSSQSTKDLIPYPSQYPKQSKYTTQNSSLILWSSDFHISPIADAKWILNQLHTKVIDKSLSSHCHLTNTCQTDLRIINQENGINLGDCPNNLRRSFYQSYRNNKEFLSSDVILCTHASSMCELFMPFNKSLAVIASTRYEIGRYSAERWKEWNQNLERIASKTQNLIAANNRYDQEYIRYFTNIKTVEYLPNICGYISDRYSPNLPRFPEVLVAPARGINQIILAQLFHHLREFRTRIKDTQLSLTKSSDHNSIEHPIEFQFSQTNFRHHQPNKVVNSKVASLNISPENLTFVQIRDLYPHFEYSDLAKHPAIVILPYQVSFMSFFEFFRMEIPLFVPSIALLIEWQIKYNILHEKSWNSVFGRKHLKNSVILKNPNSKSKMVHDPNNDIEKSALLEWLALSDFYTFPYVTTFDSWEQLFELIVSVNLKNISSHMHVHNEKLKNDVLAKWKNYTDKLLVAKSLNPSSSSSISKSLTERREGNQILSKIDTLLANFDMALHQSYQVKLSSKCIGDSGSGSVSTLNF